MSNKKKTTITLPEEGFTGETVKHTLTADDIKNNPQISQAGHKAGEEIDIVKPETEAQGVKAKGKSRAATIAEKQNVDKVFENDKGEFFTSENLAMLSVGNNKAKVKTHSF